MAGGFEIREQKLENFFLFLNFLEKKRNILHRKKRKKLFGKDIYIICIYILELYARTFLSFIANIFQQLNALIRLYIVKFKYHRY